MKFSSCFYPQIVKNVYTDERLVVSCRHCPACLERAQLEMISRIKYEISLSPFVLFFTLTYDEVSVPYVKVYKAYGTTWISSAVYRGDDVPVYTPDCDDIDFDDYAISHDFDEKDIAFVAKRDKIRVILHSDVMTFIKNFKQKFFYNYGEKIKYFICEEYGSKRLRPHYHGLLFCRSKESAKFLYKNLLSCWPFGLVNASFARNGAVGYVAKYLNSFSHYPKIYGYKIFRPKTFASRRPPIGMPEIGSKEFRQILFDETRQIELIDFGKVASVSFWRSLENGCFPRCEKFSELTFDDRVRSYLRALPFFKEKISFGLSPLKSAKLFLSLNDYSERDMHKDVRALSVSLKFLTVCYEYGIDVYEYARIIDNYYSKRSLAYLREFYKFQEYISSFSSLRKYLINLYPICFNDLVATDSSFLPSRDKYVLSYFGLDYDSFVGVNGVFDRHLFIEQISYNFSKLYDNWCREVSQRNFDNSKTKILNDYLLTF